MKIKNLILGIVTAAAALVACQEKNVNLGIPDIVLSEAELTFDIAGGEKSITLTASRDWMVKSDVDWLVFSPESGLASANEQTIVITALENAELDRSVDVQFTIGMMSEYLTVTQDGPQGSADDLIIYHNDYDKVVAEKTYGSGSSWPYLDQFNGWMNEKGTGAAGVRYAYTGMSARANSTSDSNYSDYAGSGNNNMFFGASAYFATKNIALNGTTGLSLTFGSEKYSQTLGSVFLNSEFHIFLSNDGKKWVEFTDYTFAGGTTEGRWNVVSADFTVPAGTEALSICMQVDAASSYRMDDLLLVVSEGGVAVDFSTAVEKDFSANETEGGNTDGDTPGTDDPGTVTPPSGNATATIAQVLATSGSIASGTTIEGVVISNRALNNLTSKKGLYVQDESGALQFYLAANHEFDFGDKLLIDLSGVSVGEYNGAVQISGLAVEKISRVSTGNTVTPKTVSAADFLANKYEGQYIAVEGVQVVSTDLSKTFVVGDAHTSVSMETSAGGSFVIFSSKYSTFGTSTVPQGSGIIKGISSVNNGTMQIIFAQDSDYAGLTGTRFESVTPPAGDDNTGDNTGSGSDDNQGSTDNPATAALNSSLTWALGTNAYDKTYQTPQVATVNGESVTNVLKLGKSSAGGSATVTIPSGVTKVGFYAVAWKGASATLKCTAGSESKSYNLAANAGATGNPSYTMTVTGSDYYTFDVPEGATSFEFATEGTSNCRVLIFGVNPVTE